MAWIGDISLNQMPHVAVGKPGIAGDLSAVDFLQPADDFLLGHAGSLSAKAQIVNTPNRSHMLRGYPQNTGMQKKPLRQIVAENLERLMDAHGMHDNNSAAGRQCKMIHSNIRRIRFQEISTGVDTLEQIAQGFEVQAWELLVDGDAAREAAFKKIVTWGGSSSEPSVRSNDEVPSKEGASRQRKKGERGNSAQERHQQE